MLYAPQGLVQLPHILDLLRQKRKLCLGFPYRLAGHIWRFGLPYYFVRDRLGAHDILLEGLGIADPGGNVVFSVLVDAVDLKLDRCKLARRRPGVSRQVWPREVRTSRPDLVCSRALMAGGSSSGVRGSWATSSDSGNWPSAAKATMASPIWLGGCKEAGEAMMAAVRSTPIAVNVSWIWRRFVAAARGLMGER